MTAFIGRRYFIKLLGGAAVTWPLVARAQQPAVRVVGLLIARSPDPSEVAALRQGLAESGYEEGRNLAIEQRWAHAGFDRLPALAANLVKDRVAVIIAGGLTSALAAKAATATTPIIFLAADDPVKFGLVASLSRPDGNATGLNVLTSELTTKRLELVRELLPAAATIAVLVNPRSPEAEPQLSDLQAAARAIGMARVRGCRHRPTCSCAATRSSEFRPRRLRLTATPAPPPSSMAAGAL